MSCPDPTALDAYALGYASSLDRGAIERHLDGCAACGGVVAEVMRLYAQSSLDASSQGELAYARTVAQAGSASVQPGATIGRYRVQSPLGEGAMGSVWAAHDPELDRAVALKVLHADPTIEPSERRARLSREARAMAKLAHPNVVAVYDVGVDEPSGQLFVAMELVRGTTLSGWLRQRPRSEREILEAFLAVGRGLAAAHAEGLVHRDFKPDNVLAGDDGRMRVGDFGLARPGGATNAGAGERGAGGLAAPIHRASGPVDPVALTRAGAIVGTPAYMAPEQLLGEEADARTDQFAFAVALFEALYGARPFGGRSFAELRHNVLAGRIAPVIARAPRWQQALFRRAFARDRSQRYPEVGALLDELARDRGRPRRRAALFGAAVVGLAGLAGAAIFFGQRAPSKPASASSLAASAAAPNVAPSAAAGLSPPAALSDEVAALRRDLAGVDAALASWAPDRSATRALATDLVARARALGWDPALAEALLRLAAVERAMERPKRAAEALDEAVKIARGARYDALLFDATTALVEVVGVDQGLLDEAEPWVGFALAESKRSDDAAKQLRLALALGRVRRRAGKLEEARTHLDRGLELARGAAKSGPAEQADLLRERAYVARDLGDAKAGLADAEAAASLVRDAVTLREGPGAAAFELAVADLQIATGDRDAAITTLDRGDAIASRYGRASSVRLALFDSRARALQASGAHDGAAAAVAGALSGMLEEDASGALSFHDPSGHARSSGAIDFATRIKSKVEKPDDLSAIAELNAQAAAKAVEGDEPAARDLLDEARRRAEDNPALSAGSAGAIHHNRALLSLRSGDLAAAQSEIALSLAALTREVGVDHARVAVATALEARILEKLGSPRAKERRAVAERVAAPRGLVLR